MSRSIRRRMFRLVVDRLSVAWSLVLTVPLVAISRPLTFSAIVGILSDMSPAPYRLSAQSNYRATSFVKWSRRVVTLVPSRLVWEMLSALLQLRPWSSPGNRIPARIIRLKFTFRILVIRLFIHLIVVVEQGPSYVPLLPRVLSYRLLLQRTVTSWLAWEETGLPKVVSRVIGTMFLLWKTVVTWVGLMAALVTSRVVVGIREVQ